jgi:hypothetical protein
MDLRLAIGCTLAVIAIGIAIYEWTTWIERKPKWLPPPAPDDRDSIQNFKRMHQP